MSLKLYAFIFIVSVLGFTGLVVLIFGFWTLLRVILSLAFLSLTLVLAFLLALTIYARSFKYSLYLLIPTSLSSSALYFSITWQRLEIVAGIVGIFVFALLGFVWYLREPGIGLIDRMRSAEKLEKAGKLRSAAKKYEKKGDLRKAAELYLKLDLLESAAWAFEKAGDLAKAAEIYERLYEKNRDSYYLKEAYELWKKAGNLEKAVVCLEKYAEVEPWFWEDVAKIHEEIGSKNKAREAYQKFLEYCLKEAESDATWWRHVAEAYDYLGEKEKAEEALRRYRRHINK